MWPLTSSAPTVDPSTIAKAGAGDRFPPPGSPPEVAAGTASLPVVTVDDPVEWAAAEGIAFLGEIS